MLVVTNELAGRTEADSVAAAVEVLQAAGAVEVVACRTPADLDRILDTRDGRPLIVVGGDGSLHTMVRALWRRGEAADCAVGLIPLGTGNDFARGVGIPVDDVPAAARVVLGGRSSPVDLIVDDNGGVAVNAVHIGAGAEAAMRARPLKRWLRVAAFPVGAIIAGLTSRGWRLRVRIDGRTVVNGSRRTEHGSRISRLWKPDRGRVLMVGVANARTIAGGTGRLGPGAQPADGEVDVTVSFAVGPFARVGYAISLYQGRHWLRRDVVHLRGREVDVSGEPFHVNADGEVSGPVDRLHWRVVPGGWRCMLPEATAPAPAPDGLPRRLPTRRWDGHPVTRALGRRASIPKGGREWS